MKGGGIYYCLNTKDNGNDRTINKCIIESMMRPDTNILPLTFSSMAGFIFILSRSGGLVDANGDIFLRSDNIGINGKKKQRAGSGGIAVSTLVLKIVMKRNDPADEDLDELQLVLPSDPDYDTDDEDNEIDKSSLEEDEIIIEQQNHNELYQTFHLGEKMVPSLVGDLIEFGEADIRLILDAIHQKRDTVKRAKVIRVFEYLESQIPAHHTSVIMMCMEMVGDDTRRMAVAGAATGDNTYNVISSITSDHLRVAAARGAAAIQLLCMRKQKKQLVDAHEGNWFIDTENPDNVRAIDFGRVADITDKEMIVEEIWKYKRSRQSAFHMRTSQGTFLSKFTSKAVIETCYNTFIEILNSSLPFWVGLESSSRKSRIMDRFVDSRGMDDIGISRLKVRRNIHYCLVMASIIDNAITSNSYPDWDQPQMVWAYEEVWGFDIIPDKDKKHPIHHIHTLDFNYDIFKSNMRPANMRRVNKSYDEIARLILLYTSTPDGSSAKRHMTLSDAKTRKKSIARGITAINIGQFVQFTDIYKEPQIGSPLPQIQNAVNGITHSHSISPTHAHTTPTHAHTTPTHAHTTSTHAHTTPTHAHGGNRGKQLNINKTRKRNHRHR